MTRPTCSALPDVDESLAIEIDRLSFRYPGGENEALQELSLSVRSGSLFGLLGPNGSGKTTLISILAGTLPVSSGRVRIGGRDLAPHIAEIQAASALVPQEYAFYPRLSVVENLRFFAGVQGLSASETAERIAEVLEITGLEQARRRRAERLSGGMKRRLNFAIGLLNRPRLLFLDEPTVGIDPQSRHFVLEAVRRINREGTTVVYTSHYMEEVEALCDEIGVLDRGRLLVRGTLAHLLANEKGNHLLVHLAGPLEPHQRALLKGFPGLAIGDGVLEIERCQRADFQRLIALLGAQNIAHGRVKYGHGNLEELFLELTDRQLRDEG